MLFKQKVCAQMHRCSSARRLSDAPARLASLASFSFSTLSSTCRLACAAAACHLLARFTQVFSQMQEHLLSLLR